MAIKVRVRIVHLRRMFYKHVRNQDRNLITMLLIIRIPEKERIKRAGGQVINGRVNGQLAVSRSIGDRAFKRFGVSPLPEVCACH